MSHPYPPLGMSDNHDDDGQVLTDLLTDTHEPADIRGAVEPVTEPAPVTPVPVTRILANTLTLASGGATTPLLSEDLKRKSCFVSVYSNAAAASITAADYVVIADDKSKISAGSAGIAIKAHHGQIVEIKGHTGALHVTPGSSLNGTIDVSAWGVTRP